MVRRFAENCIQGPGREIWKLYMKLKNYVNYVEKLYFLISLSWLSFSVVTNNNYL